MEDKSYVGNTRTIYILEPKRLCVFFLNAMNGDFGKNYPPTTSLNGHPNIVIVYSG